MCFQAGMKNYLKNIRGNETENEFPLARIRSVFREMVSTHVSYGFG